MLVRDIMTENPRIIRSDMPIMEAARIMRYEDCGWLPVGDIISGRLYGAVTDRDIIIHCVAEGMDPYTTPVRHAMTVGLKYCRESTTIEEAGDMMEEHQVRRLLVMDEDGQVRGVITVGDIAREYFDRDLVGEIERGVAA